MSDDPELFSIVPVVGKSRSDAIVTGPMSEVMEYIGGSVARNEKEQRVADLQRELAQTAQDQDETRARNAQMFANGIAHLATRIDQFEARRQTRADELQRKKEEAETARVEAMLKAHPDPDDPEAATLPAPGEHSDDGDFGAINPPVDPEKYDPEGQYPDPEAPTDTITGTLPEELEQATPPEPGDFGPTALPPSPNRNPTSIGLN